ncbi:MAG: protein translocase subunit SecF [Candidatus Vogelbacteria bacterium]|nr:protein translocase subunit SecF [Candidatus Vogelbacteria bacterium]
MWVIKYRSFFYILSGLAIVASLAAVAMYGLNLGIDFKGGTTIELDYGQNRPETAELRASLDKANLGNLLVQPVDESGMVIRSKNLSPEEKNSLTKQASVEGKYSFTEKRSDSIGPTLGNELATRGIIAIVIVALMIVLFISFAFWGVSRPVASWKYGIIAISTLAHDVIIPTGVFALLGHFKGTEIDALFLTALLTILGLSVNDTIVVFDRIRENLKNKVAPHFEDVVGMSLSQTFTRSINTSMTVILVLLAVYFFGSPTTKDFALVLTIGMVVGTYSSIFIASPLLVTWEKWSRK